VFRSRRDAELTKKLYRAAPVLIREPSDKEPEVNPWGVHFQRMFDMINKSHLFHTHPDLAREDGEPDGNTFLPCGELWLPLYEAKLVHHYDTGGPPTSQTAAPAGT
jgi:hypothetical protein